MPTANTPTATETMVPTAAERESIIKTPLFVALFGFFAPADHAFVPKNEKDHDEGNERNEDKCRPPPG